MNITAITWSKTTAQRLAEVSPCAAGCRGDCGQGDRECEFAGVQAAEAVSEYAGPPDWEPADAEVLGWLACACLKASIFILASLFVWHSGYALALWAKGLM